jgi:hypothetical protein
LAPKATEIDNDSRPSHGHLLPSFSLVGQLENFRAFPQGVAPMIPRENSFAACRKIIIALFQS